MPGSSKTGSHLATVSKTISASQQKQPLATTTAVNSKKIESENAVPASNMASSGNTTDKDKTGRY